MWGSCSYKIVLIKKKECICSWFVTLYFASSRFSATYQFYGSFMTYFYILNMPVDINTWRTVIGLFVNTTQKSTVFHLTKCGDFTLYSMSLFLLLLIAFKEFTNNRDLIWGTFSLFGWTASFLKQNLSLKMGMIFVSLFIRSLLSA